MVGQQSTVPEVPATFMAQAPATLMTPPAPPVPCELFGAPSHVDTHEPFQVFNYHGVEGVAEVWAKPAKETNFIRFSKKPKDFKACDETFMMTVPRQIEISGKRYKIGPESDVEIRYVVKGREYKQSICARYGGVTMCALANTC